MSLKKSSTSSFNLMRLAPYFLGGLGIALMVGGIVGNYLQTKQKISVAEKNTDEVATVAGVISGKMIQIDVSGAVEQPGVYQIPYDSRVKDVLITAGGVSAKADRNYLAKTINLAQRVVDGQKVYIPFADEVGESNLSNYSDSSNLSHLVNVNTASSSELDTLPGIGPVTAAKIVAGRPYQKTSDLVSKKVVTNSVFQKIKDKISAN
ncbi:ComEA family DNA-binding protein [Candidatus Microgenomates bacterium]|nr:ComEA family DNA-binding protein [Candidatus Microgenomates bacterium]